MKANMWTPGCDWEFIGGGKGGSRDETVTSIVNLLNCEEMKSHIYLRGHPYVGKSSAVSYALEKELPSADFSQPTRKLADSWLLFRFECIQGRQVDTEIAKRALVKWWQQHGDQHYKHDYEEYVEAQDWQSNLISDSFNQVWHGFLGAARAKHIVMLFEINDKEWLEAILNLINFSQIFKDKVRDGKWRIILESRRDL